MDILEKIHSEIRGIIDILAIELKMHSHWSGRLELVSDAGFKGKKRFTCDILIDEGLAGQEIRWSTLIHEALHTFSVGYIGKDYRDFPGWEEGVIEQLQRLLRPLTLERLGIEVAPELFHNIEAYHRYNVYIEALEKIRDSLGEDAMAFYIELLRTPIKDRPGTIAGKGNALPGQRRLKFMMAFSSANAALKGFIEPTL